MRSCSAAFRCRERAASTDRVGPCGHRRQRGPRFSAQRIGAAVPDPPGRRVRSVSSSITPWSRLQEFYPATTWSAHWSIGGRRSFAYLCMDQPSPASMRYIRQETGWCGKERDLYCRRPAPAQPDFFTVAAASRLALQFQHGARRAIWRTEIRFCLCQRIFEGRIKGHEGMRRTGWEIKGGNNSCTASSSRLWNGISLIQQARS